MAATDLADGRLRRRRHSRQPGPRESSGPDLCRPIAAGGRRTVLAVLRYLLRARTRATPFGLFAGVAAARIGAAPALRVGTGHQAAARPDAAWTMALIDRFEEHSGLRPHLMLLASNLAVERDGYVVIEHRPRGARDGAPEHVQIRVTGPVREALDSARTPILWSDLTAKLSASFPTAPPAAIEKLLAGLIRQRFLTTNLRPAMTTTDPLAALLTHTQHLAPAEAAELREAPSPHSTYGWTGTWSSPRRWPRRRQRQPRHSPASRPVRR
ncbi:lantibiotic dehydratase family protein [Streptomyces sp. PSKA30]|nr:lantibiotic dehydratase [Streptomyces sp. PSKA30]MBZ9644107.1 lantibiotic dehydratase family protein [Streptomyces sp. PSKA30]